VTSYLLDQQRITTSLRDAVAYRVRHRSYDLHGVATESTGLVIAPQSPGTERRVLSWCHGTTGLGDAACPSAQPDPAGELRTYFEPGSTQQIDYGVPGAQDWVDDGWVVCATDYQGLGTPGMHQYSVNRTNAIDALTIVRSARELGVGAGSRVAVTGWSQGGGAAAAVAELDAADLDGLELVGTAPMSPGVPIVGMRSPSGMGAALADPAAVPDGHLVMSLVALAEAFPGTLRRDDVLTPLGERIVDAGWNSQPVHHFSDTIGRLFRLRGAVVAVNQEAMPAWIDAMTEASAGRVRPSCPVHVLVDGFDGGTVIPVSWQQSYADAAIALGGDVTVTTFPDDDHFSLPASSVGTAREWLTGLFDA
jgi:pimeloyl-ACP methyl ester carboxylesterase